MLIENERQWRGDSSAALNPGFWDLKLRAQLGRDLRAQYEKSMKEPLPQRFVTLLGRLEKQERARSAKLDHEID